MRQYRGKRLDSGEWVHGNFLQASESAFIVPIDIPVATFRNEGHRFDMFPVDPKTVGQYTGLKDKNGVEIYGNDILLDLEYESGLMVVKWDKDGAVWKVEFQVPWEDDYLSEFSGDAKVVGNIFSNPELLNN